MPSKGKAENSRGERKRLSSAIRAASQASSSSQRRSVGSSNHARPTGRYKALPQSPMKARAADRDWHGRTPRSPSPRPAWRVASRTPTPLVRGQCFGQFGQGRTDHHAAFVELGQCITHRAAAACVALLALDLPQVPDIEGALALRIDGPHRALKKSCQSPGRVATSPVLAMRCS